MDGRSACRSLRVARRWQDHCLARISRSCQHLAPARNDCGRVDPIARSCTRRDVTASDVAERACNKTVAAAFLRAIAEGAAATCSALLDPDGSWWVLGWGEMHAANFLISLGQKLDLSAAQRIQKKINSTETGNAG